MPPVLRTRNKELQIDHGSLLAGVIAESSLNADAASGGSTITLPNITGFAVGQILLIGELGEEGAEIVKTHAATTPSGTTVTLAANLVRSHATGTRVRVLPYDQFELSHATSEAGSKTELTVSGGNPPSALGSGLVAIDPTSRIQSYLETEYSSGFYFARYKNSASSEFSDYSGALPYAGWAENAVGYMLERALKRLDLTLSESLTHAYLIEEGINECLRLIKGKQLKWAEHSVFGYSLGEIIYGENRWALPTDIYDRTSKKSIIAARIGKGEPLKWLDPVNFDEQMQGVRTAVRTQASAAAASLEVDTSLNFAESGTLHVFVDGTRHAITYTGVTRDDEDGGTAAFTGIPASGDGSITVTIPVDAIVRQDDVPSVPGFYTVKDGFLEVAEIPDSSLAGSSVLLDYDRVATSVDDDADTIDLERYDMVLDFLTWKAECKARKDGQLDITSGYYLAFKEKLNDAIRTKQSGTTRRWAPNINRIQYARRPR